MSDRLFSEFEEKIDRSEPDKSEGPGRGVGIVVTAILAVVGYVAFEILVRVYA